MSDSFVASAALQGFLLGASLIIAIGAQNAFVLRQGLLRQHVFPVATICFLADAALILAGVGGMGTLVQAAPVTLRIVTIGGALFLAAYGLFAARRALHPSRLEAASAAAPDLRKAIVTCLALTFLNPHVYLDTVVLLGGLATRFDGAARTAYAIGAMSASGIWFYGLGYGARLLAPLFQRPIAWRVLDFIIAIVMWMIAFTLIRDVLA
ncbi:LysE/ArgO family amino acid transporter [Roseiterribacter gracilis]|uniref:Amino acid transporter n=1 Tax=Roseiterribacter gracilis TaxID=2812848 RepID=A0A8S8X6Y9_9PROT|nr:amino acid transporter [Rhodospirillales bacterium TMPK1]